MLSLFLVYIYVNVYSLYGTGHFCNIQVYRVLFVSSGLMLFYVTSSFKLQRTNIHGWRWGVFHHSLFGFCECTMCNVHWRCDSFLHIYIYYEYIILYTLYIPSTIIHHHPSWIPHIFPSRKPLLRSTVVLSNAPVMIWNATTNACDLRRKRPSCRTMRQC